MANYGVGIGSFAEGFTRGMSARKLWNESSRQEEADKVRRDAMSAAEAQREADIKARLEQAGEGPKQEAPIAKPPTTEVATATPVEQASVAARGLPSSTPAQEAPATPTAQAGATPDAQAAATPQAPTTTTTDQAIPKVAPTQQAAPVIETPPPAASPAALGTQPSKPTPKPAMTREQAEKDVPSTLEYFQKQGVPKIAQMYLTQGNPEKAQAWQTWAESAEGARNMKTWATAQRAAMTGNFEKAGDSIMELYKSYDPNITPMSKETVKNDKGEITGFNVKLKDKTTGEERSQFVDKDQLVELGLTALSPPQMFEVIQKRKAEADKAKATATAEVGKAKLKLQGDIAMEQYRQTGRVQMEGIKAGHLGARDAALHENNLERDAQKSAFNMADEAGKVKAKLSGQIAALKESGMSDADIAVNVPRMVIGDAYKKGASPEEAARLAYDARMKSDFSFAGKPEAERQKIIEQDLRIVRTTAQGSTGAAPAGAAAPATPAARGLPFLDQKTGQVVYMGPDGKPVK